MWSPGAMGRRTTASRGLEPERDRAELALLEQFTAAGKPVLGICRGMQVINVFFGGHTDPGPAGPRFRSGGRTVSIPFGQAPRPCADCGGRGSSSTAPTIRRWPAWGPGWRRRSGRRTGPWRRCSAGKSRYGASSGIPSGSPALWPWTGQRRANGSSGRGWICAGKGNLTKKQVSRLTWCRLHGNISKLTISTEGRRRCSTMVRAPAFQAGDASSILVTCSNQIRASSSAG